MSANIETRRSRRRPASIVRPFLLWFVVAFVAVLAISGSWAMANPLGEAPDEGPQAVTAYAVAHGQVGWTTVKVPSIYAHLSDPTTLLCMHRSWGTTADCQDFSDVASLPREAFFTQFGTYNPVYYALVGWPSRFLDPQSAIYAMRLLSAVLFSVVLAAAFAIAAVHSRTRAGTAAIVIALSPIVFFLGGSVNPNAIEIAAAVLAWVSLLALFRGGTGAPTSRLAITLTTVAGVILALNRPLAPVWFVLIVLVTVLSLRAWKPLWALLTQSRYFQVHLGVLVVAALLAVWWLRAHPTVFVGNVLGHQPQSLQEFLDLAGQQIGVTFPQLTFEQSFVVFGWTEYALAELVPVFFVVWSVLLLASIALARGVAGRVGPVVLALIWVVGLSALVAYEWGGHGWQGRYGIPLAVGIPLLSVEFIMARASVYRVTRIVAGALVCAAAVAVLATGVYSFASNIRRYAGGLGAGWDVSLWGPWRPPLDITPWMIAVSAGTALLVLVVVRGVAWSDRYDRRPGPSARDDEPVELLPAQPAS